MQQDFPFEPEYLDTIGSNYGSALNEVDFSSDPAALAAEINRWVADQTEDRITNLLEADSLSEDDLLALVNALYLNASWFSPFDESRTSEEPFTLLDGSVTDVPLMQGFGASSASSDGWVGATKDYVGGLEIQFVLPDEGRFEEVASRLPAVFEEYAQGSTEGSTLVVPNFETRINLPPEAELQALGLTAVFEEGNLLNTANDPQLVVGKVLHETFLLIDEEGTEAAAATIIVETALSDELPEIESVPVILDRPFLYRIVDNRTDATLFIGQIVNPNE